MEVGNEIESTELIVATKFDNLLVIKDMNENILEDVYVIEEPYDDLIMTMYDSGVPMEVTQDQDGNVSVEIVGKTGRTYPSGNIRRVTNITLSSKFIKLVKDENGNLGLSYLGEIKRLKALN